MTVRVKVSFEVENGREIAPLGFVVTDGMTSESAYKIASGLGKSLVDVLIEQGALPYLERDMAHYRPGSFVALWEADRLAAGLPPHPCLVARYPEVVSKAGQMTATTSRGSACR